MKKSLNLILAITVLLSVFSTCVSHAATKVLVTMPTYPIVLNGYKIDNMNLQYPFIVYNDITYIPMTYDYARFMGLSTTYDVQTRVFGVSKDVQSLNEPGDAKIYIPNAHKNYSAYVADYNVLINNSKNVQNTVDNPYPLLNFRDVTYFPLTWEYIIEDFGWYYTFSVDKGLDIKLDPKADLPVKSSKVRCMELTEGFDEGYLHFKNSYDFDGDGVLEKIQIDVQEPYDWGTKMKICIGNYETTVDFDCGCITNVYLCDIDTHDEVLDLAILSNEASNDPVLQIVKYAKSLPHYKFKYEDYGNTAYIERYGYGYVDKNFFNVNIDGSITLACRASNYGMWGTYKVYSMNENGILEENVPYSYEIYENFITGHFEKEIYGEEKTMWEKGYIKAYCDYIRPSISIKTGEYFKVLYDDAKGNIFIEKQNGESGWIDMTYDTAERYKLHPAFFHMAG